jgi:hypothetical protein
MPSEHKSFAWVRLAGNDQKLRHVRKQLEALDHLRHAGRLDQDSARSYATLLALEAELRRGAAHTGAPAPLGARDDPPPRDGLRSGRARRSPEVDDLQAPGRRQADQGHSRRP